VAPRRLTPALLLFLVLASAATGAVTTNEIEESLTCQCGCGLTVHACNHLQCGSAIPLKQQVLTLISQGLSRDEILLRFRDEYGEKILSSPTTEGFNLTAWILPFVALAAGAAVLVRTVRRWQANGAPVGGPAAVVPTLSERDRRRLEAELAKGES
jgi:cytochrome c-type biogenesis protein CcmH/NrfF